MPKVTVIQVVYNNRRFIEPVFSAIFNQTFKDIEVVAVISGNTDGGKELIARKFPQVKIIDPGYNIGFAAGHNLVFSASTADFFQLVNPDFVMEPNYIEQMQKAFADEKVGAATGKLYQIPELGIRNYELWKAENNRKNLILDTTGVVIGKSGRARDRGQHEADNGQYDQLVKVKAVSAAGAMYRRSALEGQKMLKSVQRTVGSAKNDAPSLSTSHYPLTTNYEFFDEDFHSYWEDVDLAWRMTNSGWKCAFVPSAVGYHGRNAGSSRGGYFHLIDFIKHHRALNPLVRQRNYKNHIFMYIKNSKYIYPQFFIREFFMLCYTLLFEIGTLKVLPQMFRLLPKMWKKRINIKTLLLDSNRVD